MFIFYLFFTNINHNYNIIYWLLLNLNYFEINLIIIFILILTSLYININIVIFIFSINTIKPLIIFIYNDYWPISLIYGFNLIHPILFYSFSLILALYLYNRYIYITILRNIFQIGVYSLFFGMFWGSINTAWGFFWTYDRVEFALLFLLFIYIYIIHSFNFIKYFWLSFLLIIIFCIYLICLRLNIIFTIHSFFQDKHIPLFVFCELICLITFVFINNFYIYILWVSYVIIYLLIFIWKKSLKFFNNNLNLLLHLFFINIVLILVIPQYYYNILSYNLFLFNNIFNIFNNKIVNINNLVFLNNIVKLNLSTMNINYFNLFINEYNYCFYFGFFYFILIISFCKIYFK